MEYRHTAPGQPGISPRWTSSAKSGVGTALNNTSRVWFTLSHGIVDEVYYPRLDQACIRDFGFIVTDGQAFFSEEKRQTRQEIEYLVPGVPAFRLVNTCHQQRYRLEKEILSDPQRDVVLQSVRFEPLQGTLADYQLFGLLAPHLANHGYGNTAWIGNYKGLPMLFAARSETTLALACSAPWLHRSAGFVGVSDGWQDLSEHKQMTWLYDRAENGNVALTGEVDLTAAGGRFIVALAFGSTPAEAGQRARASLQDGFEAAKKRYLTGWRDWQKDLLALDTVAGQQRDLYRISTAILRTHEAKRFPGGLIASLSIPWGFNKGDDDLGGYHLAWPRDLVEAAGGLVAAGALADVRRVLFYLQATQESDGHWPQNMWLDGTAFWSGIQMDEAALPILLVELASRYNGLDDETLERLWPMVRRAAGYIVCNGPVTQQDRWEEDPGYAPFTLAVEIAALLTAADLAEQYETPEQAAYLRETADTWNAHIIDALLKVDTPSGPAWHRYDNDGYGEYEDGRPFDGTGVGRAWPLLTGERAHYELAAGHRSEAEKLLQAMANFATVGGLIPEQVWDSAGIPERELFCGRPSGSAMPLVWAHAEYVKLRRSLQEGRVFDMPPQPAKRYIEQQTGSPYAVWRFNHKIRGFAAGQQLRIEVLSPARVHWSPDGWQTIQDTPTVDTGLGIHLANLSTARLEAGTSLNFTVYWTRAGDWEGTDFAVEVIE